MPFRKGFSWGISGGILAGNATEMRPALFSKCAGKSVRERPTILPGKRPGNPPQNLRRILPTFLPHTRFFLGFQNRCAIF
jgi:hypothetical protein